MLEAIITISRTRINCDIIFIASKQKKLELYKSFLSVNSFSTKSSHLQFTILKWIVPADYINLKYFSCSVSMLIAKIRLCEVNHTMFQPTLYRLVCQKLLPQLRQERPCSNFLRFCFTFRFTFTSGFVSMTRLGSVQKLIRHEANLEFLTIFNQVAGAFSYDAYKGGTYKKVAHVK